MCLFLHRHKHSTRRKVLKRVVEVQRRKIRPLPSVLQCRVFKRDQPACICGSRQGERPPAKTCSQAWSVLVSLWPCARSKMAQLPDRFWTLTQHHFRSVLHVASWISQVLRSEVPLYNKLWILRRVDPVGRAIVPPLKPTKVTLFAISWCNSENNISKPIPNTSLVKFEFPHCSRYKTILSTIVLSQQCCEVYFISLNSSGADTRLDYQILLKSPPPLTLLGGSTPGSAQDPRIWWQVRNAAARAASERHRSKKRSEQQLVSKRIHVRVADGNREVFGVVFKIKVRC